MIAARLLKQRESPTGPAASALDPSASNVDASSDDAVIACAVCDHVITTERERIERFGGHAHDRVNPAGIVFRILLFGGAAGACIIGTPSHEFAWFPHHVWQIALCARCRSHLGWSFSGADGDFFGLREDGIHRRSSGAPN